MCAVPNMAVFSSSLTSWFPGMLLTYFLNDFEMIPVPPIITGPLRHRARAITSSDCSISVKQKQHGYMTVGIAMAAILAPVK
jgi:hypothetical protein